MNDKVLIEHIDYTTKVINVQDEIQQLRNRVAELERANKLLEADQMRLVIDCITCSNRGVVNGLSQETFCEHCIHSTSWKRNYYKAMENKNDNS